MSHVCDSLRVAVVSEAATTPDTPSRGTIPLFAEPNMSAHRMSGNVFIAMTLCLYMCTHTQCKVACICLSNSAVLLLEHRCIYIYIYISSVATKRHDGKEVSSHDVGPCGAPPESPLVCDGFKVDVNSGWIGLPRGVNRLRDVACRCLQVIWCRYYSRIKHLKPQYTLYSQFCAHVSYFWFSPRYRSFVVHYRRSSLLYNLCVCAQPSRRVQDRKGFHANNGHVARFCLSEGLIRMKCFDVECSQTLDCIALGDPLPFQIPQDIRAEAEAAFTALENGEELALI